MVAAPKIDRGTMLIETEPTINNTDFLSMVEHIDNTLIQLSECPSARDTRLLAPDYGIAAKLIEYIEERYEIAKEPDTYMASADPYPQAVQIPPVIHRIQNPYLQDLLNQLAVLRKQLVKSPQASQASGFHPGEIAVSYDPFFVKLNKSIAFAGKSVDDPPFSPEVSSQLVGQNQDTQS